jgi:hypothetical protein
MRRGDEAAPPPSKYLVRCGNALNRKNHLHRPGQSTLRCRTRRVIEHDCDLAGAKKRHLSRLPDHLQPQCLGIECDGPRTLLHRERDHRNTKCKWWRLYGARHAPKCAGNLGARLARSCYFSAHSGWCFSEMRAEQPAECRWTCKSHLNARSQNRRTSLDQMACSLQPEVGQIRMRCLLKSLRKAAMEVKQGKTGGTRNVMQGNWSGGM